ncbi:putative endonuclease/exonuclease/phosphatase, partial [Vibrio parahaemolyticus SBR10290]
PSPWSHCHICHSPQISTPCGYRYARTIKSRNGSLVVYTATRLGSGHVARRDAGTISSTSYTDRVNG